MTQMRNANFGMRNEMERENGAEAQNRTADTRLFRPLLYQLSYLGTNRHAIWQEAKITE